MNFFSNVPWGLFTTTVITEPGAPYLCPDGTQRKYTVKFTGFYGGTGYTRPKWQVVGVTYAPPGTKSSVSYAAGFLNGTSESVTQSFTSGLTIKATAEGTEKNPAGVGGSEGGSVSVGWSQETDSSTSVSIVEQDSTSLQVPGPQASAAGVDHDFDIIYIWLNPELSFAVFPQSGIDFQGYAYDQRDTVTGMDVVPLTVGQLKGKQTIPSDLLQRLDRTWDTILGALNSTDFAAIVAADPFANNASFNPNTDTSGRFEFPDVNGQPQDLIVNYIPAAVGEQASQQTYTSSYNTTTMKGQGAKNSFTVGFSTDGSVTYSDAFKATLEVTASFTWSNQWSAAVTAGASQSANFTIVGPLAADGYTGPTAMQVWKDNVYGSFMFYPEN